MPTRHRLQHAAEEASITAGLVLRTAGHRVDDGREHLGVAGGSESATSLDTHTHTHTHTHKYNVWCIVRLCMCMRVSYPVVAQQGAEVGSLLLMHQLYEACTVDCIAGGEDAAREQTELQELGDGLVFRGFWTEESSREKITKIKLRMLLKRPEQSKIV